MKVATPTHQPAGPLEIRSTLATRYADVYTAPALAALEVLAPFDRDRQALMAARLDRRRARAAAGEHIAFLHPDAVIGRTAITVRDARAGRFEGGDLPAALDRQWIQGTGPAARPNAPLERSLRNVAYALLSGADGWMFDGEDALGQLSTMALDNQRNLHLALSGAQVFLDVAAQVADEMNAWARGFFGRAIISDWRTQLDFTLPIFRARGLHLDDRHVRWADGTGFSASIVDLALHVANNRPLLGARGRPVVLYLPKIQTAEEAALWHDILSALEHFLGIPGARSRPTCWSSSSRPATSSWRSAPRWARTSPASTPAGGTTSTASPTRWRGMARSTTRTSTPSP